MPQPISGGWACKNRGLFADVVVPALVGVESQCCQITTLFIFGFFVYHLLNEVHLSKAMR
jgi:hypothetical protein